MWDGKRKLISGTPIISKIIIHHSAGGFMENESEKYVQNMVSDIGFSRGYVQYGYNKTTGYSLRYGQNNRKIPNTNEISFAEYHYIIHKYNKNYRIIQLVDDPMNQDVGSVFDYKINCEAIAICFAGNYEVNEIPEDMIDYFNSCFDDNQPLNWILYKNPDIEIIGHKDCGDKTVCPGKYLYAKIPIIRDELKRKAEMGKD